MSDDPPSALSDLRVIDMATVVAGPAAAKYLADFGAEVIKVEAPAGDSARRLGWAFHDGDDSFFWKIIGRNKKCVTLDLKSEAGLAHMFRLVTTADALIENFRPGTLERLGLGPEVLLRRNPKLVVLRLTGFGQTGPYAKRPGFATVAEAITGYAALSGEPEGPPLLPPIAITDEIAGLAGAFAVMAALWHARRSGQGQVVDVNLAETLLQLMGPLVPAYAHLGYEQPRMGSSLPWTVPRGTYRCKDGKWVALSASADSVAARLLGALGLASDPRFKTFRDRMHNREVLEEYVRQWVAERSSAEVIAELEKVDAAVAPIYTMRDVFADPHFKERQSIIEVDGVAMPNVIARFSATPGKVRHAGRHQGEDQDLLCQGLEA
jgi:crotonobetainyl-CoA:carnitine CoA-transferase CaiB-like acyl-CoA transferase